MVAFEVDQSQLFNQ